MSRPVVALLSDFGTRDHYAGAMKGVVLRVCPDATLVDISHEIPPQDVLAGALELAACYRYFPAGTVFLVIVDPGVGSSRRAIAAEAGDYRFVAPDNGVLSAVFEDGAPTDVVELAAPADARGTVSATFEGRDRFAPAAGRLASGAALRALGPPVSALHRLEIAVPVVSDHGVAGEVLRVDRFGNLITNIDRRSVERLAEDGAIRVTIAGREVAGVVHTYADVPAGRPCALFSSTGRLEIAINTGSAAESLGLARGAPVIVRRA